MARFTVYLDDSTQALVARAAAASGMSKSRWVTTVLRERLAQEWPQDCFALAGKFADFPLCVNNWTPVPGQEPRHGS